MIVAAAVCSCCARSRWFATCWFERALQPGAPMTTMDETEWDRTRWLRRDLVRVVGAARWYAMSVEACDAAVRDAEARSVDAAAEAIR